MPSADVVIVGSGLAALQAAEKLCYEKNVIIITKKTKRNNNSNMAQGGVAAAMAPDDDWTKHYEDTLTAGCYYNDTEAVQYLVQEGAKEMRRLIQNGMTFDGDESGLHLGQEGAHSMRRILHAGGDATGSKLLTHVLQRVSKHVQIIEHEAVLDLLVENGVCVGVVTRDESGTLKHYHAAHTVLATGGIGSLYSFHSNDATITGDGLAMAYRAGAELVDLEFVQFHPTMLYVGGGCRGLVSEAVRGEGAILMNSKRERFMERVHEQKDLAPRDVVSRAIYEQMMQGERVYLDISMISSFSSRFPTISELCQTNGIRIEDGLIPVVPGVHFHMGGIKTNLDGETSVPGLYAVGEAACNGVHGANRLASNSLLEGIVFGARLGRHILHKQTETRNTSYTFVRSCTESRRLPEKKQIQAWMMQYVGIVRTEEQLLSAKRCLENCLPLSAAEVLPYESLTDEQVTIFNMLTAASLITNAALKRHESIGAHYRSDYPYKSERPQPIVVSKQAMLQLAQ